MASIMIIDNRQDRRQLLEHCLEDDGHDVTGIGDAGCTAMFDTSGIELVILNLYPDAFRTWELYLAFKEKHPQLPVLVYLQHSVAALKSIRQIVASIVSDGRKGRRGPLPPARAASPGGMPDKGGGFPEAQDPAARAAVNRNAIQEQGR